ncbi:MAG: hypothetical protein C4324_07995 [Blastocatellia bacterium]
MKKLFCLAGFIFVIEMMGANVTAQKYTAEEVRERHLASIAIKEKLAALKNILATGTVRYKVLRQGGVGADGRVALASDSGKSLIAMNFPISTYPSDKFVFNGKKVKIDFAYNNVRSYLGNFLYGYDEIVSDGLLGGILSVNWPLYQVASENYKLDFEGKKTIEGREMLVLRYVRKGGSDLAIKLFFDPKTFAHLRTEYRRLVSSQIGSISGAQGAAAADASSSVLESRQSLIEEFSDFKNVDGYNLPQRYRAYILLEGSQGTREYEWVASLSDFYVNQAIDASVFEIPSNQ